MRFIRTPDLLSVEQHSMVDAVRRTPRPRYARSATWFLWVIPGGLVWLFVVQRIVILLLLHAFSSGQAPSGNRGLEMRLHERGLGAVEIQRLLGGQPVRDPAGRVMLDPAAVRLMIFGVDQDGSPELRYQGGSEKQPAVLILIPSPKTDYLHVVAAIDTLLLDGRGLPHRTDFWISRPM